MPASRPLVLIDNEHGEQAQLNLALEEYIVRRYDVSARAFCLIYANAPSVIVGKHQTVWEEVDVAFCRRQGLAVLRRISGGGTVYHDRGNLNISFITRHTMQNFNNYRSFLRPVVQALAELHISAEIDARNNLLIDGKKISGNAQFTSRQTLLSHGTLLYDTDLKTLRRVLKVDRRKILKSKGTKSAPASVTNVALHLKTPLNIQAFREHLLRALSLAKRPPLRLPEHEWQEIRRLADEKYNDWEWNYGRSPACVIERNISFQGKVVALHLHIDRGHIVDIRSVSAEHASIAAQLTTALRGLPYTYEALYDVISALRDKTHWTSLELSGLLAGL